MAWPFPPTFQVYSRFLQGDLIFIMAYGSKYHCNFNSICSHLNAYIYTYTYIATDSICTHVKPGCELPIMNVYIHLRVACFSDCIFFDSEIHRYELCRFTKRILCGWKYSNDRLVWGTFCSQPQPENLNSLSFQLRFNLRFQLRFVTPKALEKTFVVTVVIF